MGIKNTFPLKLSNIFITGATGFVGSHLLRRLVREKCKVHISIKEEDSLWRIKDIRKKYVSHSIDLRNYDKVRDLIKKIKPDIIIHLAAYGVDYREQDISQAVDVNIKATVNLYDAFLENKGSRFIHTGSCNEYGHKNKPISENDLPNPVSIYGITKYAAVQLLLTMAKKAKSGNLVILRLFNLFGEGEGNHRFVPQIIEKLRKGRPLQMTPGEQVRDYIYIKDIINAYIKVVTIPLKNAVEIINIGSGKGISLKEFALKIAKKIDANESLLQFGALPYRSDEPMYLVADIKKAKRLLGWRPSTSLEKRIEKIIEYYKKR